MLPKQKVESSNLFTRSTSLLLFLLVYLRSRGIFAFPINLKLPIAMTMICLYNDHRIDTTRAWWVVVANGNLKMLRERRALSLSELALMSNVSRGTINRIENGKQKPSPSTIRKLAQALNVNVEELTSDQGRLI